MGMIKNDHDVSQGRRRLLQVATGAAAWGLTRPISISRPLFAEERDSGSRLGLVAYCCGIQRKWLRSQRKDFDLFHPLHFLKHCEQLGAGGIQVVLGRLDDTSIKPVRELAERHALFVEGIVAPPADRQDLPRFESEIRRSAAFGAQVVRTVIMPGRRYERFSSLQEFRKFERIGRRMVELAAPIVEKHRVGLAIENHKDQRVGERVALLEHIDSEFVGACVDTGNSIALLEDPVETVNALCPWAKTVHLKDQALKPYPDGFLLGDIPLGKGAIDLKRIVAVLRRSHPKIHFSLELITRDPLKVPCLTAEYWRTLPHVGGSDLARTLRRSRQKQSPLQTVSGRPVEEQRQLEEDNVRESLQYARDVLGI